MIGAAPLAFALTLAASPAPAPAPDAAAVSVSVAPGLLRLAEGSRAALRFACAQAAPVVAASTGRVDALHEASAGQYEAEYVPPESLDPQVAFVTVRCGAAFGWAPVALAGIRDLVLAARYGATVTVAVGAEQFGPAVAGASGRAVLRVVVPPGVRMATRGGQRIDLGVRSGPSLHVALDRPELDANAGADVAVHVLAVDERGEPLPAAEIGLSASDGRVPARAELRGGVARVAWALSPARMRPATLTARLAGKGGALATASLGRVAGPPRRLALEVARAVMVAGEGEDLGVTALVEDAAGNPADSEVALVARGGTVVEWERVGPGRHAGRVVVPSHRSGPAALDLEATAGALRAARSVALVAGPARAARVEARDDLAADGRTRELRVSIVDAYENRVDVPAPPVLGAARGRLGAPVRYAPGGYRVPYRTPLSAQDVTEVVVVAAGPVASTTRLRVRALGGAVTLAPAVGFTMGSGALRSVSGGAELGLWGPRLGGLGLVLDARSFGLARTDAVGPVQVRTDASFLAATASLAWRRPLLGGLSWIAAGGGAVWTVAKVGAAGQPALRDERWTPAARASAGWGRPVGFGMPFLEVAGQWQAPAAGPLRGALRTVSLAVGYRVDVL